MPPPDHSPPAGPPPTGPRLARLRLARGWSQSRLAAELCAAAGVPTLSRHEISRWERQRRVPGRFWRGWLAQVLDPTASPPTAGPPKAGPPTAGSLAAGPPKAGSLAGRAARRTAGGAARRTAGGAAGDRARRAGPGRPVRGGPSPRRAVRSRNNHIATRRDAGGWACRATTH
ncbi:helix-turn-helix domain-containing protein [Micromonospora radicis]|uniref:helix-turn-helix domain-containing protein n=1 Tax=Micromonospora radicis TaxID=1894971 RepID=UPI0018F76572|nr:helix-turn-helix transcriptional regulator [Micromonospora radicis]